MRAITPPKSLGQRRKFIAAPVDTKCRDVKTIPNLRELMRSQTRDVPVWERQERPKAGVRQQKCVAEGLVKRLLQLPSPQPPAEATESAPKRDTTKENLKKFHRKCLRSTRSTGSTTKKPVKAAPPLERHTTKSNIHEFFKGRAKRRVTRAPRSRDSEARHCRKRAPERARNKAAPSRPGANAKRARRAQKTMVWGRLVKRKHVMEHGACAGFAT